MKAIELETMHKKIRESQEAMTSSIESILAEKFGKEYTACYLSHYGFYPKFTFWENTTDYADENWTEKNGSVIVENGIAFVENVGIYKDEAEYLIGVLNQGER